MRISLQLVGRPFQMAKTFLYETYLDHPNEQLVRSVELLQDKDRMTPPVELNNAPAPVDSSVPKIIDGVKCWWRTVLNKWFKHSPDQCRLRDKGSDKQAQRKQTVRATMARIEESPDEESLPRPVIKRCQAISKCFFPFPSLGAFFSWWWAQALMLVVSYALVPWCCFGWIIPTTSECVRPHFSPIIEWFDHLRSKIKRTANNTINCFNSNLFVRCLKILFSCVIFMPMTTPLKLFRMWSQWHLQPDLKRERMRGLPYFKILNLMMFLTSAWALTHPVVETIRDLNPEFTACAPKAHHMDIVPEPPPPASNNEFVMGMLSTAQQSETFCDLVHATTDTGGSCYMGTKTSDVKKDTLRPSNEVVKTCMGHLKANLQEGELDWMAFTDAGIAIPLPLQRSLLVPHAEGRIFGPQHWAQNQLKLDPKSNARMGMIDGKYFVLSWTSNGKRHKIAMLISSHNDTASLHIRVPSSSSDHAAFLSESGLDNDKETVTFDKDEDPNLVTDDEASVNSDTNHPDDEDFHKDWTVPDAEGAEPDPAAAETTRADDFNFAKDDPLSETEVDIDEEEKLENLSAKLLWLHHKFNHVSLAKIKALARLGVVDKKLADVPSLVVQHVFMARHETSMAWKDQEISKSMCEMEPSSLPSVDKLFQST